MIQVLSTLSKVPLHKDIREFIQACTQNYGKVRVQSLACMYVKYHIPTMSMYNLLSFTGEYLRLLTSSGNYYRQNWCSGRTVFFVETCFRDIGNSLKKDKTIQQSRLYGPDVSIELSLSWCSKYTGF